MSSRPDGPAPRRCPSPSRRGSSSGLYARRPRRKRSPVWRCCPSWSG
ncbi:hypothetical protein GP913_26730 [Enterobacteriaceae bacterium 8376wG6]|nr:hypothetical protein [Enterobacteriaceae bacterium 8376wG6]